MMTERKAAAIKKLQAIAREQEAMRTITYMHSVLHHNQVTELDQSPEAM